MAVKIVRQAKNIALLGVPTSAGSPAAGYERAPATLREAGLIARLGEAGFTVADQGNCTVRVFDADEEHPRARNVKQVLATLEELRPKIELAVKSGALPVILGGDSSIVLATVAGARRYFRNVSLIFLDGSADLKEPATTQTGLLGEMVISHVLGRGAPELVRFWGEPPLVRAPDVALFGIGSLEEAEQQFLIRSPLRRHLAEDIERRGGESAADEALDQVHGRTNEFVLHIDLGVIVPTDFKAADPKRTGGLGLDQVRPALSVFARQRTLAALVLTGYNPDLDADGASAKQLIELIVGILAPRLEPEAAPETAGSATAPATGAAASKAAEAPSQADAADRTSVENPPDLQTSIANPSVGTEAAGNRSIEMPSSQNLTSEHGSVEGAISGTGPNASMERVPGSTSPGAGESAGESGAGSPDSASPDVPVERETP